MLVVKYEEIVFARKQSHMSLRMRHGSHMPTAFPSVMKSGLFFLFSDSLGFSRKITL